jgi:hypothetical protein
MIAPEVASEQNSQVLTFASGAADTAARHALPDCTMSPVQMV